MAKRLVPVHWTFLAGFVAATLLVGLLAGVDPKLAIAASIAVGFALIVFADLTAGLAVFAFFSFLEVLQLGSAASVGKLGGALLALGWIAFVMTRDDAESDFLAVHPAMSWVLVAFLGWVALSAVWAESTHQVFGSFGRYLLNVILFLIVFTAVRSRKQASMVIAGFLGGAVAAAVYGLVLSPQTQTVYGGRLTGAGLDPNELASIMVAGVALSAGLAISLRDRPGARLAAVAGGALCLTTALLTGSRGGLVALAFMLLAAVLFGGRWRGRAAALAILLAAVSTLYVFALAPPTIRDHILGTQSQGEQKVPEYRTTLWQIGGRMFRANPILGVGADNFQVASRHYLLQPGTVWHSESIIETPTVAHNTYLQTAAELGIVGIGLFGAIAIFSIAAALKGARNFSDLGDLRSEALARSIAIATIAILAADFFISEQYNKQLWLLLGIGPAILAVSQRARRGRPVA